MNYDLLVLINYATTSCEEGFCDFSVMELFMLLLNYYNENLIRKFLINYRNEDRVAYFEHVVSVSTWFETQQI